RERAPRAFAPGEPEGEDRLVAVDHGLAGALEELLDRDLALAAGLRGEDDARSQDVERRDRVAGGRGVAGVAAQRRAVADLDGARDPARLPQRRGDFLEERALADVAHGDERAELEVAAVVADPLELLDPPDVDPRAVGEQAVLRLDEEVGA